MFVSVRLTFFSVSKFNNAENDNISQTENNITKVQGIKGLSSGVFYDNLMPSFLRVISVDLFPL
jgi:hypothetical protein